MSEVGPVNPARDFWNVVASIAAEDKYIKGILGWLVECDLPESLAEDYYRDMGEHLTRQYGVPEAQWNRVFNYCETNILVDEAQHG